MDTTIIVNPKLWGFSRGGQYLGRSEFQRFGASVQALGFYVVFLRGGS